MKTLVAFPGIQYTFECAPNDVKIVRMLVRFGFYRRLSNPVSSMWVSRDGRVAFVRSIKGVLND